MAVAHVYGRRTGTHAVGERAAAGDHEVVPGDREPIDREREEGQQAAEARLTHGQPSQSGDRDTTARELRAEDIAVVEQGVDGRPRPAGGHLAEGPLRAPLHQQVVVDQADRPRLAHSRHPLILGPESAARAQPAGADRRSAGSTWSSAASSAWRMQSSMSM